MNVGLRITFAVLFICFICVSISGCSDQIEDSEDSEQMVVPTFTSTITRPPTVTSTTATGTTVTATATSLTTTTTVTTSITTTQTTATATVTTVTATTTTVSVTTVTVTTTTATGTTTSTTTEAFSVASSPSFYATPDSCYGESQPIGAYGNLVVVNQGINIDADHRYALVSLRLGGLGACSNFIRIVFESDGKQTAAQVSVGVTATEGEVDVLARLWNTGKAWTLTAYLEWESFQHPPANPTGCHCVQYGETCGCDWCGYTSMPGIGTLDLNPFQGLSAPDSIPDCTKADMPWAPLGGCNLPALDASSVTSALSGKWIVFIGDSTTQELAYYLVCYLKGWTNAECMPAVAGLVSLEIRAMMDTSWGGSANCDNGLFVDREFSTKVGELPDNIIVTHVWSAAPDPCAWGFEGARTFDDSDFQAKVIGVLNGWDGRKPDIVLYNTGMHDLGWSDFSFSEYQRRIRENLELIVQYSPDSTKIWKTTSPKWMREECRNNLQGVGNPGIKLMNDMGSNIAADLGIDIFDQWAVRYLRPQDGDGYHCQNAQSCDQSVQLLVGVIKER